MKRQQNLWLEPVRRLQHLVVSHIEATTAKRQERNVHLIFIANFRQGRSVSRVAGNEECDAVGRKQVRDGAGSVRIMGTEGPYPHILNRQLVTGINSLDAVAFDATLQHAERRSLRRNKGGRGVRLKGSQRGLMAMVSMIVSRDYRIDPGNFIGINRNRRRPVNTRVEGFSLRRGRTKVRVDIDRSLR